MAASWCKSRLFEWLKALLIQPLGNLVLPKNSCFKTQICLFEFPCFPVCLILLVTANFHCASLSPHVLLQNMWILDAGRCRHGRILSIFSSLLYPLYKWRHGVFLIYLCCFIHKYFYKWFVVFGLCYRWEKQSQGVFRSWSHLDEEKKNHFMPWEFIKLCMFGGISENKNCSENPISGMELLLSITINESELRIDSLLLATVIFRYR